MLALIPPGDIAEVAMNEATDQENTTFLVQGKSATNLRDIKDVMPRIKVKVRTSCLSSFMS